jgi:hypothetical protein
MLPSCRLSYAVLIYQSRNAKTNDFSQYIYNGSIQILRLFCAPQITGNRCSYHCIRSAAKVSATIGSHFAA